MVMWLGEYILEWLDILTNRQLIKTDKIYIVLHWKNKTINHT